MLLFFPSEKLQSHFFFHLQRRLLVRTWQSPIMSKNSISKIFLVRGELVRRNLILSANMHKLQIFACALKLFFVRVYFLDSEDDGLRHQQAWAQWGSGVYRGVLRGGGVFLADTSEKMGHLGIRSIKACVPVSRFMVAFHWNITSLLDRGLRQVFSLPLLPSSPGHVTQWGPEIDTYTFKDEPPALNNHLFIL